MAKYNGTQSLLDASLGEYAEQGFSLVEPDDDSLELYFKDHRIAVFNKNVTIPIIQEGCRNYLNSISRW